MADTANYNADVQPPRIGPPMIVTCPSCRTRYRLGEETLKDPAGRVVRCANCGHSWHQLPQPDAAPAGEARRPDTVIRPAPLEAPRADPAARPAPPIEIPRMAPAMRSDPVLGRPRRSGSGLAWLVILLLIAGAAAGAILGRTHVIALWPGAARIYALAGLAKPVPGAGLKIGKVTPSRTSDGLIIEGEVKNTSAIPHRVPRLRIVLQNHAAKDVQFKIVDPPKPRLLPGEVEHFKTPFEHPSATATRVVVTFAPS